MHQFRKLTIICIFLSLISQASAANKTFTSNNSATLLEVYTSQGCSSCPPAEKWMSKFVDSPDLWERIIPINFHVDYWDYLGWEDPFAFKAFSQRQRRFNQLGLTQNVATPGFIVNGKGWNGWFYRQSVPYSNIAGDKLTVILANQDLQIDFDSFKEKNLYVNIAILGFGIETPIKHGENKGKNLKHDFIVTGFKRVRMKNNQTLFTAFTELPKERVNNSKKSAIVVWLSTRLDPSPIQVVGGWL